MMKLLTGVWSLMFCFYPFIWLIYILTRRNNLPLHCRCSCEAGRFHSIPVHVQPSSSHSIPHIFYSCFFLSILWRLVGFTGRNRGKYSLKVETNSKSAEHHLLLCRFCQICGGDHMSGLGHLWVRGGSIMWTDLFLTGSFQRGQMHSIWLWTPSLNPFPDPHSQLILNRRCEYLRKSYLGSDRCLLCCRLDSLFGQQDLNRNRVPIFIEEAHFCRLWNLLANHLVCCNLPHV